MCVSISNSRTVVHSMTMAFKWLDERMTGNYQIGCVCSCACIHAILVTHAHTNMAGRVDNCSICPEHVLAVMIYVCVWYN